MPVAGARCRPSADEPLDLSRPDHPLWKPQLPIETVLPSLFSADDPVAALRCLHAADLLPKNRWDLYRSFGMDGDPPDGLTRDELIAVFALYLGGVTDAGAWRVKEETR